MALAFIHPALNETTETRVTILVLGAEPLVPLLGDGELDAAALGQGDVGLGALADHEDVAEAGGEGVAVGVLDVDNVEGSGMPLAVHDGAHAAGVAASGHHAEVAGLELDVVHDLVRVDVQPDGVVDLEKRKWDIMR